MASLIDRVDVIGVGISAINMPTALATIDSWIGAKAHEYVCVCTVHTVMECRRSARLRDVVNASGMTTPDGMPLVWLARLDGRKDVGRVYGPDLLLAMADHSISRRYRHFFYGGRPGVAAQLINRLQQRFPGLSVAGSYTPIVGSVDELCTQEAAEAINRTAPDIVWVGISSPKQDLWMNQMRSRLNAPVLIGVGAAFDFHAGLVPQAPGWMQRAGLEWLFRLIQEPRRLWKRYLVDNPWFVWEVLLQKARWKRFA